VFVAVPSQPDALQQQLGLLDTEETLLGSFLRAVSHDLRSPLLTLSLAMELLGDLPADERGQIARDAITHGLQDMARMLDAVSGISRARRRILAEEPMTLAAVLDGIRIAADAPLMGAALSIDARAAGEALRALGADVEVRVEEQPGFAVVSAALPEAVAAVEGSAVAALLGDLHTYAGTPAVALAAAEVVLARQGGMVRCEGAQARMWLPVLGRSPE
jgi:hypothetical protein